MRKKTHIAHTIVGIWTTRKWDRGAINHIRVPFPCVHVGLVHVPFMSERAGRIARGHADPKPYVASPSEWAGGSRSIPLSVGACQRSADNRALEGGRDVEEHHADLLPRDVREPSPSCFTTGGYILSGFVGRAHGRLPHTGLLLWSVFCHFIGLCQWG